MINRNIVRTAALLLVILTAAFGMSGCGVFNELFDIGPKTMPEEKKPTEDPNREATDTREPREGSFGYESLPESLQEAYITVEEYINELSSSEFTLYVDSTNEIDRVLDAYEDDHPEEFWVNTRSRYSYLDYGDGSFEVELNYLLSDEALQNAKQKLKTRVQTIADNAPESASDYELELYINDYIIDNCDYSLTADMRHTAYGALIDGKAVCDGYSKAFQILCNTFGINCVGIQGDAAQFNAENGSDDSGHMWNCVQIQGEWFHVDVTWNDGDYHIQRYAFLNLTTDKIKQTHTISPMHGEGDPGDNTFLNTFVPECTSTEYNYYQRNCVTLTDLDDADDLIYALANAAAQKEEYFDFLIADNLDITEVNQKIADGYGSKWFYESNRYNDSEHQLELESRFYSYADLGAITFVLQYQS